MGQKTTKNKNSELSFEEVREIRKRRRERFFILGLAVAFTLLTLVELRLGKISSTLPFVNSIFFFGLINFNIIILVALLWLIFKNVGKIFFERRSRVLGSRLKTKLVAAFIGFSTIPTLTIFVISALYINQSFDKWFSIRIQNTLQNSIEITSLYYQRAEQSTAHFASVLAKDFSRRSIKTQDIEKALDHYGLDSIEIYDDPLKPAQLYTTPEHKISNPNAFIRLSLDRLRQSFSGAKLSFIQPLGYADLVRSTHPIYNFASGHVRKVIVVNELIPVSLTARAGQIVNTAEDYKDTNPLKYPIKTTYLIILILITLLIIFGEIWLGLYLARELTVPVERLVKAAKEIGKGRLDLTIERTGNDEIAVLIDSFNKMTQDLRQNQFTIQQRTQQLETILSNISTGVLLVDPEFRILTLNHAARTLLNLPENIQGSISAKEFIDEKEHAQFYEALVAAKKDLGKPDRERTWSAKIHGEFKTLSIVTTPLKDRTGIWGVVAVLDDFTFIVKGQREAAWREVAKRIAHEIKNPLTPIKLSAQRLQRRLKDLPGKDGQLVQECTAIIVSHTDELKDMVNEFSNFARFPESNPTINQMNNLIQETMQLYLSAHPELHFIMLLEPNLPEFPFDWEQMRRVFLNLIDNAIHAIKSLDRKGPGRIEIETHYNKPLEMMAIMIRDNGPGMSEETLDRAFEPYFSTKKEGSGLGLAIVKRIIHDHGGYIRVSAEVNKGTTFTIELPTGSQTKNLLRSDSISVE